MSNAAGWTCRQAAMAETALEQLARRFLAHHAAFFPVDATFIGLSGFDHQLPPADSDAAARELEALGELTRALDVIGHGSTAGERLDIRLMRAALTHKRAALDHWPRFKQPSWYTGETAFGIISLLLPSAPEWAGDALRARLAEVPRLLDQGIDQLRGAAAHADWSLRAAKECGAIRRLLAGDIRLHPFWRDDLQPLCETALRAIARFEAALAGLQPGTACCGREYLHLLMRDAHGLPWPPEEAVALAEDAFARLGSAIKIQEQRLGAAADTSPAVSASELPRAYEGWHQRALADSSKLVTPAAEYGLAFAPLPDWARNIAADLYFLSYRCPPAFQPGQASRYWTAPAEQSRQAVKQVHAVHHGSIGHHTQNARARAAASLLARIGGADCASGIAFLSAGTMTEGWSCYATELMAEAEGFYSADETLALLRSDRRNAASVLADIRLHTGEWTLERMRAFYRDEAGFPAARIWGETTRNSIFPATRLMYFLGTEQIKALRREIGGDARAFHDELISHGHVPIAWAADEMRQSRLDAATGKMAG